MLEPPSNTIEVYVKLSWKLLTWLDKMAYNSRTGPSPTLKIMESIELDFRHMLIYFSSCKSQRFSRSQIFIFIFSTLKFIFSKKNFNHTYLSYYISHLPKNLGKSVIFQAFMAKYRISLNYFWTYFRWKFRLCINRAIYTRRKPLRQT